MARAQIMTGAGIVSFVALLCSQARGLDDSFGLLQVGTEIYDKSASVAGSGEFFKSKTLQLTGADSALDYITELEESGTLEKAIESGRDTAVARAPPKPLPLPMELTQIVAEMKTFLHSGRAALDPARFVSSLKGRGVDFPTNFLEEEARKAAELEATLWRHNDSAHDEILASIPKLYGLFADPGRFASLAFAANNSQHDNESPATSLAKHFPDLLSNASLSLAQLGLAPGVEQESVAWAPWAPPKGSTDPYIRFASHHGVKFSPKAKEGFIVTLTVGYKNHFYKSLMKQEKLRSVMYGKIVVRVGLYRKESSGYLFGGQLQVDLGELHKGIPFKQAALTLRVAFPKAFKPKDETGFAVRYLTTSQLGAGIQRNFQQPKTIGKVKAIWADLLNTFDFEPKPDDEWGGFNMNAMLRIGMDRDARFANKFFVFSKMRYAPEAKSPDIRVRLFCK